MALESSQLYDVAADLVLVIFLSLYSLRMNSVACPDGSMMSG